MLGDYLKTIVSDPTAQKNLNEHGNILGKIERNVDWTFGWSKLCFRIEIRSSKAFMGRFGGGWNFNLGIQFSTLSCILVRFGIGTLSIVSGKEAAGFLERHRKNKP